MIRKSTNTGVRWIAVGVLMLACSGSQKATPEKPDGTALLENEEEPVKEPPASPEVKRARTAIEQEDFEKARGILEPALQQSPDDPQAVYYYAVTLEGLGEFDAARAEYEKAIELAPSLIEAYQNLSYLLLSEPDESKLEDAARRALSVIDSGLEKAPKDPGLLANRATALDILGSPDALGAYQKAVEAAPDNAGVRFNYALMLAIDGKNSEAKAQLAQLKSQDVSLLIQAAQVAGKMQDFDGCIALLGQAVDVEPKNPELYVRRGVCKHGAGDDTGAQADYEKALSVDADSPLAHYYLGRHLLATGDEAGARQHFDAAVRLDPGGEVGNQAKAAKAKL